MDYLYFTADVFTREIFNGAQIAVFPSAAGLDDRQMQLIARELNLSETVFAFSSGDIANTFRLRIFSPLQEIPFGGHPILAAAHVLASNGQIDLKQQNTPVVFEQNQGPVQVNISQNEGRPGFIQFTMKVRPIVDTFAPSEQELASIIGIDVKDIERKKFTARMVSCGFPYLIVPLRRYAAVREARFNFSAWSESLAPSTAAQEILLFCGRSKTHDVDFHARLVGPDIGLKEDPPIGSAMPALMGFLCSHEHIREGTYTFSIDRGDEAGRHSVLSLEMDNKKAADLTLRVGGESVLVTRGTMTVPGEKQ